MPYSIDVDRARDLATIAHSGQHDKAGEDYINHPRRVAERLTEAHMKVVGWLHDVVEDTDVTIDVIRKQFGDETGDAIDAVTHRENESWSDYLSRVKKNPVAKAVKISDLIDNSNLSRIPNVRPKDIMRQEKYNRALRFLMDLDG